MLFFGLPMSCTSVSDWYFSSTVLKMFFCSNSQIHWTFLFEADNVNKRFSVDKGPALLWKEVVRLYMYILCLIFVFHWMGICAAALI